MAALDRILKRVEVTLKRAHANAELHVLASPLNAPRDPTEAAVHAHDVFAPRVGRGAEPPETDAGDRAPPSRRQRYPLSPTDAHVCVSVPSDGSVFAQDRRLARESRSVAPRGGQCCCHDYLQQLAAVRMLPSMTDENHCYQHAVAERVNGMLKVEFDLDAVFPFVSAVVHSVERAITIFNSVRTH